jgi:small-conductance mechanosensitive channel
MKREKRMNDQSTFLSRVSSWLKRKPSDGELPLERHARDLDREHGREQEHHGDVAVGTMLDRVTVRRPSIFRPFARRDHAIQSLQSGFSSLADLMSTIRDNLETQGRRQDQMLSYLSNLPEILQSLPETHKIQAETLKSIGQQLESQVEQQRRLTDILDKVSDSGSQQREFLEQLNGRVESLGENNEAISENLRQFGASMENVGKSADSSAQILQQLRDNLNSRDTEIQSFLQRQNSRLTIMLTVAIILSVASIIAVAVMGFLLLKRA